MKIESKRLLLKDITWNDLEDIHRLHSIPEVDEYNTLGLPKNIEETRAVISPLIDVEEADKKHYSWIIETKDSVTFIGLAGMVLSDDKYKQGEIYYKLLPAFWGKGFATEVSIALVRSGFDDFNLHIVAAGVATKNQQSIRVLEKSGMTREGLRRKILPIRGEWVDNYQYAILEDDPRPS